MSKLHHLTEKRNPDMTLLEWRDFIDGLIHLHGPDVVMWIDSGRLNSATLVIEKREVNEQSSMD